MKSCWNAAAPSADVEQNTIEQIVDGEPIKIARIDIWAQVLNELSIFHLSQTITTHLSMK